MAETPCKPQVRSASTQAKPSPLPATPAPPTPAPLSPRRSRRLLTSSAFADQTPRKSPVGANGLLLDRSKSPRFTKKSPRSASSIAEPPPATASFYPASPDPPETKKRRRPARKPQVAVKRKIYYNKVVYDGGEFEVGDDVYVKRREDAESDGEDPEMEECRICSRGGKSVMIECDDCLGGFHLKCLKPPLKKVPEGDWVCTFCQAKKLGNQVDPPKPPEGKKISRTAKEKLLSSDLWAARLERLWREPDGTYWANVRWYLIPDETAAGRQPHNLRRELYLTNDFDDIEMESVLRHCYVMDPKEFTKAANDGDDVFLCEYEYDVHWHSFKRLVHINKDDDNDGKDDIDEEWNLTKFEASETDEDSDYEKDDQLEPLAHKYQTHELAANSCKGRIFGLQRVGIKRIPEHVRCHKQTELERAKAMLLLATLPKTLPCRTKEMEEINTFIKSAMSGNQCLGSCLYIHGVPGTGKTMTVHSVMRNLRSEVDSGFLRPYSLVEINGLKLASPEAIYKAIYESLTGHRIGWKKALNLLNERFCEGNVVAKEGRRPCILLIDELDLLVTRNQSVLYNILDWPTRPRSRLIVIGIANTMDLPEKLLPRISSRMGIQRLCFGPYNYQQLQEIISNRLKGLDVFEEQAIEFASRKEHRWFHRFAKRRYGYHPLLR